MNDLERHELLRVIERARDRALDQWQTSPHLTSRSVGLAVAEAAMNWHTRTCTAQQMISREHALRVGVITNVKRSMTLSLSGAAADAGCVPTSLPTFQETWVAFRWNASGEFPARHETVPPSEADFLRLDAFVTARPPWTRDESDCACGVGDLGHRSDCGNFDPTTA